VGRWQGLYRLENANLAVPNGCPTRQMCLRTFSVFVRNNNRRLDLPRPGYLTSTALLQHPAHRLQ